MSNSRDALSPVNRAMVAGALVGATSSCLAQWKTYQNGEQTLNQTAANVARDATKAGLISGGVMAVANASAGRPLLTMLAIVSAGVAGMYLLDEVQNKRNNDDTAD